jgi:hypothetical protein
MLPAMDLYGLLIIIAAPVTNAVDLRKSLLFFDIVICSVIYATMPSY